MVHIAPQLCTLVERPPVGPKWAHEIKWDGYRAQLAVRDGRATIFSKNGLDWTHRFPELAVETSALPDCVLDGEIVALDEQGRSDFPALLTALSSRRTSGLVLMAFDVLEIEGEDLRGLPFEMRRRHLGNLLELCDGPACDHVCVVDSLDAHGPALMQAAKALELEGIVSKRVDAPYTSGRSPAWLKTKFRPTREVVIGGFTLNGAGGLSALLTGAHQDGALQYIGRVGTGFSDPAAAELLRRMNGLLTTSSPFAKKPKDKVQWVKPELVAEIEIGGLIGGKLRQASFKRLREDVGPAEVIA